MNEICPLCGCYIISKREHKKYCSGKTFPPDFLCGHSWENHHHGCVMNAHYATYPLNFNGIIAQECEEHQVNGDYFIDKDKACKCNEYIPNDKALQRKKDKWIKEKYDERT